MMISKDIQDSFYSGNKTVEMHYTINDAVKVLSGDNAGDLGSVISIIEIEPEFKYLVPDRKPSCFLPQWKYSNLS